MRTKLAPERKQTLREDEWLLNTITVYSLLNLSSQWKRETHQISFVERSF